MNKLTLVVLTCIFFSTGLMAQIEKDQHQLSDEKKEKMADKLMKEGSYYSAVEYYTEVWSNDTIRYDLKYKIALSYFFSRDYKHAEQWFSKAVMLDPKAPTLAYFYLGESQRCNEKYKEAKNKFIAFKKIKYKGVDAKQKRKLNANYIKSCDFAIRNKKSPVYAEIENLGDNVNSSYTDFSPVATSDTTLIFASLRSDTVLKKHSHTTEFYPVHLFESTKINGNWNDPVELGKNFNRDFAHSANVVYTPNKQTMYFTMCKPIHDVVKCHIYESHIKNGEWSHPKKIHDRVNSLWYTSTQPTLGYYTKKKRREVKKIPVMYFVSDRVGTKGGLDIWYTELGERGHFSRPKNCGSRINTVGDEISPFYNQKEKTMYFSSNYHHGFGGMDIFKTNGKTKAWKKPQNIGYNLNSSVDDVYYTTDSTGIKGYLVSNRVGGHALTSETCCDDIYSYNLNKLYDYPLIGIVYDKNEEKEPLLDATVSLYHKGKDKDSLVTSKTVSSGKPFYIFQVQPNQEYYLKAIKDQYNSDSVVFSTINLFNIDTLKMDVPVWKKDSSMLVLVEEEPKDTMPIVVLETNEQPSKGLETIEEDPTTIPKIKLTPNFILKNVLHDFDISAHNSKTRINIDDVIRVMKENPYLKITIESHTDSKGTEEYNINLSRRRAQSARSYLIRKGISGARMRAKYFGETKPIAPNTNPDGSDNPEGRALNRRTEFKVLSNSK